MDNASVLAVLGAGLFVCGYWVGKSVQAYKLVRAVHENPQAVLAWVAKIRREMAEIEGE